MNKYGVKIIALVDENGNETSFNIDYVLESLIALIKIQSGVEEFCNIQNSTNVGHYKLCNLQQIENFFKEAKRISLKKKSKTVDYVIK